MICLNPIAALFYFLSLAVNIVTFFLVIRILAIWKPVPVLKVFDQTGRNLVDGYLGWVERRWHSFSQKQLSSFGKSCVGLLVMQIIGVFVTVLSRWLL